MAYTSDGRLPVKCVPHPKSAITHKYDLRYSTRRTLAFSQADPVLLVALVW